MDMTIINFCLSLRNTVVKEITDYYISFNGHQSELPKYPRNGLA